MAATHMQDIDVSGSRRQNVHTGPTANELKRGRTANTARQSTQQTTKGAAYTTGKDQLDLDDFENFLSKEENGVSDISDNAGDSSLWESGNTFAPQLVFIEPSELDQNSLEARKDPVTIETQTRDSFPSSRSSSSNSGPVLSGNGEAGVRYDQYPRSDNHSPRNLTIEGPVHQVRSQSSIISTDSELIMDHQELDASETDCLISENDADIERQHFHGNRNEWHCHRLGPKSLPDSMARNQLMVVSVLCFVFMCGEAIGGALSNSLALFTDVLHLGSDLISFLISLLALYLSRKPATKHMSFGYHRAEVLGALFSVFVIWMVTGVLCYMAVERIVHEHYKDVKPDEMLVTAVLGVVFNIIMGFVLHSEVCCKSKKGFAHSHHGHSHGGRKSTSNTNNHRSLSAAGNVQSNRFEVAYETLDDQHQEREGESDASAPHHKNINVRAAFIHVLGDIIQSLGVLIASVIIKLKPEEKYRLADPICTFLFSLLVLITTVTVLRDTLRVIMEGVPRDTSYDSIKSSLKRIPGVVSVHSLAVWCLTLDKNAIAVHLATDPDTNQKQVLSDASEMLRARFDFLHMTIQVEDYRPHLFDQCSDCQEIQT